MMAKTVILRKAVNSRRKLRLRKVESPWSETGVKNIWQSQKRLPFHLRKKKRRKIESADRTTGQNSDIMIAHEKTGMN